MESILLLSRLFLAAIFATAGITKLLDLKSSETAVRDFGVPEGLVKPISIVLPVSEVVIALILFPLATAWIGAIASLVFLAWFTIGMGYQMAKGNAPDCHCFGQLHNEPVSVKSLVRNAIFSIPAVFLVAQGAKGQGPSVADSRIYTTEMVFGLVLTLGVAGILLLLKVILDKQTVIIRRLEVLEVISAEGGAVERNEAGDPADGLPIGAFLPDFELPDLRGRMVNVEDLLGEGKPILFLFVAPTCQPCGALLPEIAEWQREFADKLNFVFISTGPGEENVAKFGRIAQSLLLQKNRDFQTKVYAKWTPSALLVNAEGRVASHVAAGDSAIRLLIEKVRSENVEDPFFYFAMERKDERPPRIGQPAPEFELKDLEGQTIGLRELRGKPTLVTFWSPTCPHCHAMIEQIKEWEKARGFDDPNLLVFSDGDPDAHREAGISSPILIDKAYGISSKFGMFGTPSAVLVDERGRIVSETAVGASNIWSLVGWRKDQ